MICTIGSLVQETSNRWRWLLSAGLYTLACTGTAMLLGTALGALGSLLGTLFHSTSIYALSPQLSVLVVVKVGLPRAASSSQLVCSMAQALKWVMS